MKPKLLFIAFTAFCTHANIASAQALPGNASYSSALALYQSELAGQYELFNGDEYVEPYAYKGSTYFLDNHLMARGSVTYNSLLYTNVLLNYDVYSDALIGYNDKLNAQFVMAPHKVSEFELRGHRFIRITPAITNAVKEGYYEVLYSGKTPFLAKRIKTRREQLALEGVLPIYDDKTELYLLKNNVYHKVKSKSDILKALKDKQEELNTFIKSKALKFNDDRERSIAIVAAYYDQISTAK